MKSLSIKFSGLFFAVFAVVHVLRVLKTWEVMIGGTVVPMAVSYVAIPVSAILAYSLLKGEKKKD